MFFFRRLLWLLFLTPLSAEFSFAAVGWYADISYETVRARPAQITDWTEDFFESDELWVIPNKEDFLKELRWVGFDSSHELYFDFVDLITQGISDEAARQNVYSIRGSQYLNNFLFLPGYLRAQLSHTVLEAAYRYLIKNGSYLEHEKFASIEAAVKKLGSGIRDEIFEINGQFYVFINRSTWPKISRLFRSHFVEGELQSRPENTGLKIELKFSSLEDCENIAASFASGGRKKIVAKYLKKLLRKSQQQNKNAEVQVNIANILPPFSRKNWGIYESCTGANCFATAVNMSKDMKPSAGFADIEQLRHELRHKYWKSNTKQALIPGDQVIFYNKGIRGELQESHAATFIGYLDGAPLVFVKNGFSRFSPYIIQSLGMNNEIFSDTELIEIYHRNMSCAKAQ